MKRNRQFSLATLFGITTGCGALAFIAHKVGIRATLSGTLIFAAVVMTVVTLPLVFGRISVLLQGHELSHGDLFISCLPPLLGVIGCLVSGNPTVQKCALVFVVPVVPELTIHRLRYYKRLTPTMQKRPVERVKVWAGLPKTQGPPRICEEPPVADDTRGTEVTETEMTLSIDEAHAVIGWIIWGAAVLYAIALFIL